MADLMFKRGLYANLHKMAVTDGAVYFTTDTNEIYFDDANGRHRIQDVLSYNTLSDVVTGYPSAEDKASIIGRLIYVADQNILMTWNGTQWVQVNAQKTLTELLSSAKFSVSSGTTGVTVQHTIGTDANAENNVSAKFGVQTTTANTVTLGAKNGNLIIDVKETEERAELSTAAAENGAKIVVTNERDTLNAAGTATETVERESSEIEIIGDGIVAEVGVNEAGKITVNADFTAKVTTENGAIKLSVDKDGTAVTASTQVAPMIKLQNADAATAFTSSGNTLTATLPVYSITETDAKIKVVSDKVDTVADDLRDEIATQLASANAMTFKGTVGDGATYSSLPMSTAQIGDTYKVVTAGPYATDNKGGEETADVGDLFIATSTTGKENSTLADGTTPVISASEILWVYVPAGDDANHELYVSDGIINLGASERDRVNGTIEQGTAITVRADGTQHAYIDHADVEHTTTEGTAVVSDARTAKTLKAVTGVTVNEQGHVTGIETIDVTLSPFGPTNTTQRVGASATAATIKTTQNYVAYNADGEQSNMSASPIDISIKTDNLVMVDGGDNKSFSINHPVYNPIATEDDAVDTIDGLTIVSAITTNAEGHVTGYTTTGLTNAAIAPTAVNSTITASENNGVYSATVITADTYGTGDGAVKKQSQYAINSKTLVIEQTGSAGAVNMNLVWGSF